ncbi:MAG TPA: sugar ABC transporter ATP-binding protein [Polyangiaceae bacterium]|nr:sugar ABC transporter ATP-binding protein [Polyangiaceae bacterium]
MAELTESAPLLSMQGVAKRFGNVQALSGVDFSVREGEVHALLGENGAGKSTLMKILAGAVVPDSGTTTVASSPFSPRGPRAALAHGIAMIYQETSLAPDLTIAENVVLGREPRTLGVVRRARAREIASAALERLGHSELSPDRRVASLGPGERQLVEIARALSQNARLLVMDEPTSSLSRDDAERLFDVVKRLAKSGVAIVYISHFLEEVVRVADRYTVLRDGRNVATGDAPAATPRELSERMIGRNLGELFVRQPRTPHDVALTVDGLSGKALPESASFTLRRGEVLGIAGLVGAGQTEMLRALFGLDPTRGGTVKLGAAKDEAAKPWTRLAQGLGLLSSDRAHEGLALGMSIADNMTLSHLDRLSRRGLVDRREQTARAARWIESLGIRCPGPDAAVGALSGGGQQKVALARLLDRGLDILLLDEPTRGIDVGSRAEIYRLIDALAREGKAIVLVSSYLPELLGLADRIAVMHRGRLSPPRDAATFTEASLLEATTSGADS